MLKYIEAALLILIFIGWCAVLVINFKRSKR